MGSKSAETAEGKGKRKAYSGSRSKSGAHPTASGPKDNTIPHLFKQSKKGSLRGLQNQGDGKSTASKVAQPPPGTSPKETTAHPSASTKRTTRSAAPKPRQLRARVTPGPMDSAQTPIPTKVSPKKRPRPEGPSKAKARKCQYLTEAEFDGETYHVGDSAYVVMNPTIFEEGFEEGEEECALCNKAHRYQQATKQGRGRAQPQEIPMLECGKCLWGFHLDCLDPPLTAVPKGDWLCPGCQAGAAPRPRPGNTAQDRFLSGDLEMVRIEAIWQEKGGDTFFAGRWYAKPEETHTGRQKHHNTREVFLTQQVDENDLASLLRPVEVLMPAKFGSSDNPDAFLCEYEYDTQWQRFRRRSEEEAWEVASDGEWAGSDADSEDEGRDRTFLPVYALWMEKGLIPAKNMRGGRSQITRRPAHLMGRGKGHRKQGGDDWTAVGSKNPIVGLGAAEIPAATREKQEANPLQRAHAGLALTAAPANMPCRDGERSQITRFVEEAVLAGDRCEGQCLYVSGVPGTGKTATVMSVMRELRTHVDAGSLPAFHFVEINSLRLPSPQHAYVQLHEALTGVHMGPASSLAALEEIFSPAGRQGGGRRVTVVLLDEMDLLLTKSQAVLYNLFEWPARPHSGLAVIGVANTMDLPERLLPRIASRLGGRRVPFQPYTTAQLEEIVRARLICVGAEGAFDSTAIKYASRKVAAVSGDVRRVLELVRRATELAQAESGAAEGTSPSGSGRVGVTSTGGNRVTMRHVDGALEQMFGSMHIQLSQNACRLEKILLASLLLEIKARARADATLEDVAHRLHQMCEVRSEPHFAFGEVMAAVLRLGSKRVILTDSGARRLRMRLSLNMPVDDLAHVLQTETAVPWLRELPV